jgi:FKBP-type peptidyl-prolyl cis-trans isomerase
MKTTPHLSLTAVVVAGLATVGAAGAAAPAAAPAGGARVLAPAAPAAAAPAAPAATTPIPAPADVAAPPSDAEVTKSGLASKVLQAGTGKDHPLPTDKVTVNYTGWTTDGKMFDSSVARGRPALFPLNQVINGWTEGVQLMVQGEKRRFWIPASLAYAGRADRPQGTLVFDVELLNFQHEPTVPPDVAAPPADAERTASGLASKVIAPGTGTRHVSPGGNVQVYYSGWTTDGKMFDTTFTKGVPAFFQLPKVIPGWREGIPLMVEGEIRRFWVPKSLAYKGQAGMPEGMLVFDVQLVKITKP